MALPTHTINVEIIDSEGSTSTVQAFFNGTDANAETFATAFSGLVDLLSQGGRRDTTITKRLNIGTSEPVLGSDNEIKAKFTFRNADGKLRSVSIPAFDRAAYMLALSDSVNTSNQDIIDFVTLMTDTAGVVDLNNIDLVALKSALEHYGNRQ